MDETRRTLAFVGAAALVTVAAYLAAPADPTPEAFSDRGEAFFPGFTDPNEAASLEVIDFDEVTGGVAAFNVVFKGTRWRIPSHHNYPADDRDRLARTAAGIIEVRKDDVVAEVAADHEALGVVDPLDESAASLAGRGKRVTIKDGNDNLLADLIVGKSVPGREGRYRYLRVPGQKRTYAARFDVDVSSRFGDWIEQDLLEVDRDRIEQVILRDYSIDERTRLLNQRDTIILTRGDPDWAANRMRSGQKVDGAKMEDLLKAQSVGDVVDAIMLELDALYGDPFQGQALYNGAEPALGGVALGCAGCHENESAAPLTAGTWTRVNDRRLRLPRFADYSEKRYFVESIVQPAAYLAPDYDNLMPAFYGSQLTAQQLADLVAYLDSQDQLLDGE